MREITLGGKQVRVRATPLTLLYYNQEFNKDLIGDVFKMKYMLSGDLKKIDFEFLKRIVWAMAKAEKSKDFPSFKKWSSDIDDSDFIDIDALVAITEEVASGFLIEKEITSGGGDGCATERYDLKLLAIGKWAKLSFEEMNEMRVRDLIEYINIYTGEDRKKPRKATQADIDRFFAM